MNPGKQPAGLKLTSGSGGQTFYEVPFLVNRMKKSLYLIDTEDNYITGIIKPIDRLSRCLEQDQGDSPYLIYCSNYIRNKEKQDNY